MKSATLPPLRVTPALRTDVESVLAEGESLSSFIESSLRREIDYRRTQTEFIARGLAAREQARTTGGHITAEQSLARLDAIIARHRSKA